jgi:hypothetical protein
MRLTWLQRFRAGRREAFAFVKALAFGQHDNTARGIR